MSSRALYYFLHGVKEKRPIKNFRQRNRNKPLLDDCPGRKLKDYSTPINHKLLQQNHYLILLSEIGCEEHFRLVAPYPDAKINPRRKLAWSCCSYPTFSLAFIQLGIFSLFLQLPANKKLVATCSQYYSCKQILKPIKEASLGNRQMPRLVLSLSPFNRNAQHLSHSALNVPGLSKSEIYRLNSLIHSVWCSRQYILNVIKVPCSIPCDSRCSNLKNRCARITNGSDSSPSLSPLQGSY